MYTKTEMYNMYNVNKMYTKKTWRKNNIIIENILTTTRSVLAGVGITLVWSRSLSQWDHTISHCREGR